MKKIFELRIEGCECCSEELRVEGRAQSCELVDVAAPASAFFAGSAPIRRHPKCQWLPTHQTGGSGGRWRERGEEEENCNGKEENGNDGGGRKGRRMRQA